MQKENKLATKDDELKKIAAKIIGRHSFQQVKNLGNEGTKKLDHMIKVGLFSNGRSAANLF
uniref:Uncharacterized protein n=1 Tax=Romanomermis culicivorax TaxID=13658 RepID=A0A915L729_ROMCU